MHNIIHAALEFAEVIGLPPCKEFRQTTRFFLEENTDEIELIEIECGRDGKPFYTQGLDSDMEADRMIKHLTKTLGSGNFDYILETDNQEYDEDFDPDYIDELKEQFLDLFSQSMQENLSPETMKELTAITNPICCEISDEDSLQYLLANETTSIRRK